MVAIFSGVRAPLAAATKGVVAIMMPLNSNMIGIHKPTPTAIAARSCADKCPAIMVSIRPKPAWANCVIKIGIIRWKSCFNSKRVVVTVGTFDTKVLVWEIININLALQG